MTGLLITLGILLFVAFILLIKLRLVIDYHGNDVTLTLKVLGLPFRLLPKKVKKRKIRLSDYSYKAVEKRKRKEEKKKDKKKRGKAEASDGSSEKPKEKPPLTETISFITKLVKYLLAKFFGHLRIDVTEIRIAVGSDDAAKTAIMFGIINQAAAALFDILSSVTNVKKNRKNEISVYADFSSESIQADINLGFSLRVWHILSIALGTLLRYVKNMIKKNQ